jgi:hypothetical protein
MRKLLAGVYSTWIIAMAISLGFIVSVSSCGLAANTSLTSASKSTSDSEYESYVQTSHTYNSIDLFEKSYARATNEQKKQLDALKDDKSIKLPGQWTKRILIIMNELPADTPMLTMDDISLICQSDGLKSLYKVDSIQFQRIVLNEFNQIAGAPDYQGGSGMYRFYYFLDADHKRFVQVIEGLLFLTSTDNEGNMTSINLCDALYKKDNQ